VPSSGSYLEKENITTPDANLGIVSHYFATPCSCVGLTNFFPCIFIVVDGFGLLNFCEFYAVHTVHILVISTATNLCNKKYQH
jgi:hypothetical protein